MLGRLAKWLRLLGVDTLYEPHIDDSLLLRIAREQERIILTRDTRLIKIKGINNYLLLEDNNTFNQLSRVIKEYDMLPQLTENGKITLPSSGRCSICNELLKVISREKARPHVPEYVYKTTQIFQHCIKCGRFYWKGSHQENLQKKLTDIVSRL